MAPSTRTGSGPCRDLGPRGARRAERPRPGAGFTLIEMIIVATLISILAGIALPQFQVSVQLAKEAVLKEDLFRFRDTIDQYRADKGYYPESLGVLVDDGYLREIPEDPITGAVDWEEVPEEPDFDNPAEVLGIYDVRSSAPGVGMNGEPYSEW